MGGQLSSPSFLFTAHVTRILIEVDSFEYLLLLHCGSILLFKYRPSVAGLTHICLMQCQTKEVWS